MDIKQNYTKWIDAVHEPDLRSKLLFLAQAEINDAFYKELEFGTGGLRGIMGAGTNRMNTYTVGKATQGLCEFLRSQNRLSSVAIAYDSRINSEQFAKSAAEVIAGNGAKAYLFMELMPTPVLSYAVRRLGCDAGIVITASHNPAEYNGFKVYGRDGCQITLQAAESIQGAIGKADIFSGVIKEPFEKAVHEGHICYIGQDLLREYFDQVAQCSINPEILRETSITVIYTPLNGAGNKPVSEILTRAGLKRLIIVPEQENPDGLFPTCQKPNPEEPSAYEMALKLAGQFKTDLLIATDPDCDRVGVAVVHGSGYVLLTGNETGCLLLNYILSQRKAKNTLPKNPVIIKTIVTSAMANVIAEEYGVQVIETLTGFKYIGEQIGILEQQHEEGRYVLGFEESYGYLPEVFVRDKDAISTSLLICEMAAFYQKSNSTLLEELQKLYKKFGFWKHKLLSFEFGGADGGKKIEEIMSSFREGAFTELAKMSVIKTDDYLRSVSLNKKTGKSCLTLPQSDVMVISLENSCEIAIRPSGTEPKLKCYLTVRSDDSNSATRMLKELEDDVTTRINTV